MRHILLALSFCVVCACAHRPPLVRPPLVPAVVGEIAVVNASAAFVLVDVSGSAVQPGVGVELITKDAEGQETARLKVTPEAKRPFITADIVRGLPKRGDKVYQ
jgi:hypothetical protein